MARSPATRAPRKLPIKETPFHMTVAAYLRRAWPEELPWWHTPNGERREKKTRKRRDGTTVTYSPDGEKLKRMGALAGVPDLTFLLPNGQAAFLELKATDGVLSDAQIEFRDRAMAVHCGYATARTLDEVEVILARWLALFNRKLRARVSA